MNIGQNKSPRPALYGFHAVREAWLNPQRTVFALYLTEESKKEFEPVLAQARGKGLRRPGPQVVDKKQLDKMLPPGAVHQGLGLSTTPLDDIFIQDFIIKAQQQNRTVLLMLDQVTDPHNVGAILRSACAFGADGVIMQRKHAPEIEGVLAKTACGGVEHVPVAFETNLSRAIEELKENGFFVYGLDEAGYKTIGDIGFKPKAPAHDGKDLLKPSPQIDLSEKILLVLGSEGYGIRRLVKENCDELVRLPTTGAIASLNVSNAAAVALYALSQK